LLLLERGQARARDDERPPRIMIPPLHGVARTVSPFDPDNDITYRRWRAEKLVRHPASLSALTVEIRDPRALTAGERDALISAVRRANLVVYACGMRAGDPVIPRVLGRQLGLARLDRNFLADDDGVSRVTVAAETARGEFIPYTNRPIGWHTDGYYNPPERRIRAMLLHCVQRAAAGGENTLLDHEIAYLRLRDEDPAHVRALMLPDALTIPAREDEDGIARPAETGPVFSIEPQSGALHMRYTARTKSIEWKRDAAVAAAVTALARVLATPSPYHHRIRLQTGMGVLCNNVLHNRTGFVDDVDAPRLLYRARYYDRVAEM
jgi:alpha-ketoglutarate-dependent taurine dioxygenase